MFKPIFFAWQSTNWEWSSKWFLYSTFANVFQSWWKLVSSNMSFCSWAKQEIYRDNFSPGEYVCRFVLDFEWSFENLKYVFMFEKCQRFVNNFYFLFQPVWLPPFLQVIGHLIFHQEELQILNDSFIKAFQLRNSLFIHPLTLLKIAASRSMNTTPPGQPLRTPFTRILFPRWSMR